MNDMAEFIRGISSEQLALVRKVNNRYQQFATYASQFTTDEHEAISGMMAPVEPGQ